VLRVLGAALLCVFLHAPVSRALAGHGRFGQDEPPTHSGAQKPDGVWLGQGWPKAIAERREAPWTRPGVGRMVSVGSSAWGGCADSGEGAGFATTAEPSTAGGRLLDSAPLPPDGCTVAGARMASADRSADASAETQVRPGRENGRQAAAQRAGRASGAAGADEVGALEPVQKLVPTPPAVLTSHVGGGVGHGTTRRGGPARLGDVWDVEQAQEIARDLVASIEPRWSHLQAVGRLAEELAARKGIPEHVVAAAWLHDIGYGERINARGFHPLDGAVYLRSVGAPADVVALVAWHTGARYEAAQRGLLRDLEQMPHPAGEDLDAVTMVDLAISPTGEPMLDVDRIGEILTRYEEDDAVYQAVKASTPHLLRSSSRAKGRLGLPQDWPICG